MFYRYVNILAKMVDVWTGTNKQGNKFRLPYGRTANIQAVGGYNRAINSLHIPAYTSLLLFSETGFVGDALFLRADEADRTILNLGLAPFKFGGKASSAIVTPLDIPAGIKKNCCTGVTTPGVECREYGNMYGGACVNFMRGACAGMDAECQLWCKNNPGSHCDAAAVEFCKKNPHHAFCTCINSPGVSAEKGLTNPRCFDLACLKSGYLTANMKTGTCPDVVNCEMQTWLQTSGVSLAPNIRMEQNCGDGPGSKSGERLSAVGNLPREVYVMIIILIVAVFAAVYRVNLLRGSDSPRGNIPSI